MTEGQLTKEKLEEFCRKGVALRQKSGESEAYRYLKGCFERIRDERILDTLPSESDDIECYGLACDVVLEYAGTCTQQAFKMGSPHLHQNAVYLEKWIYDHAMAAWNHARDESGCETQALDEQWELVVREMHRAGNSLGVSYQRPKQLFRERDTKAAVNFSAAASEYYRKKAKGILASHGSGELSEDDRQTLLNCIRYCGNHAAALYQRAEDYVQEGDTRKAIEHYDRSWQQRLMIEKELIEPAFGSESLKYCQSLTQRAGIAQAKAKCGVRGGLDEAKELYGEAIRVLSGLEADAGEDATSGGCVTIRVARLGAQFGLAWCLLNAGDVRDAYDLHRQVYAERVEVLGEAHMDTGKSARATEIAHKQLRDLERKERGNA